MISGTYQEGQHVGKRGPVPTPTKVLNMRGSWRAKTRPQEPHALPSEKPPCPAWLDADARKVWRVLIPQLARIGVLTRLDQHALARYCTLWIRWRKAETMLARNGEVVEPTFRTAFWISLHI
jgi:phage terminase small subunit